MKSRCLFPFLAVLALCLSGCIPSLNPFYTEADLRAEPGLAGRWRMTEKDRWEDWVFAPDGETGHTLSVTTNDAKTGEFSVRLFELNGQRFFDMIATKAEFAPSQYDLVGMSLFKGHLLGRVEWTGDRFRLALFDFEWLSKYLDAKPGELAHQKNGEKEIVLTADTAALQRFVLAHSGEGELFNKYEAVWVRQTDEPAATSAEAPAPAQATAAAAAANSTP